MGYSDPTYEAWKQPIDQRIVDSLKDSDPTYEAWKLSVVRDAFDGLRTPILPMRHGNFPPVEHRGRPVSSLRSYL